MAVPSRVLLSWLALTLGCSGDPPLDVAKVDLAAFQGPWYEIARLSRPTEARCTATKVSFTLKSDVELDAVSECRVGTPFGPPRRELLRAVVMDPNVPAKLSLDYGDHYADHWIVEIDSDHTRAAVAHPSRDELQILYRTPSMPAAELSALTERLRKNGFDVSRLELTPQHSK